MYRIALIIFGITLCFACYAQNNLTGKVVAIADGDTFTLLDSANQQIKIRLYGIDCPERKQPYSRVATNFVSERVFQKNVWIVIKDEDRYKRTVGVVFYNDSVNLNMELLRNGLAWHYKYYDKSFEYSQAEIDARQEKKGLWKDDNPIPPWDFRKK